MSKQGSKSNKAGNELEDDIEALMASLGIAFQKQVIMSGPNPAGHKWDFQIELLAGPCILECKSIGRLPGSIKDKLYAAVDNISFASIATRAVLIGGRGLNSQYPAWFHARVSTIARDLGVTVIRLYSPKFRPIFEPWLRQQTGLPPLTPKEIRARKDQFEQQAITLPIEEEEEEGEGDV